LCFAKTDQNANRYKASTVNAILSHLKDFYAFLIAKGESLHNPFFGIERMREGFKTPKNILTRDQMKSLLKGFTSCD